MEITYKRLRSFKELDLLKILESYGYSIKRRSNGSFLTLCPFHEEKEPSFSVTQKNGVWLWHCFGCNEGGTVIDFIMKKENLTFKEAYDHLKGLNGSNGTSSSNAFSLETSSRKVLDDVAGHYHKTLKENKESQEYLESRGLWDPVIIKDYKLGFSDGSLPRERSLRRTLNDLGIINFQGREHLLDCVTFPIEDEYGHIVSMYGRNIRKRQHLYLKGPHKGVFNARAIKNAERIFITEGIIDALSLIKMGFKETIALYGTNGFTSDHEICLRNSDVKRIYFCLDNDPQGKKAQENLIQKVPGNIPQIFKIKLPDAVKDPNEALLKGVTADEILEATEEFTRFSDASDDWVVTKEVNQIHYKTDSRSYRIRGLSTERLDVLKVTLKIETDKGYHLDTVDLYSHKQRAIFSKHAQKLIHIDSNIIERDLKGLINRLEEIQTQILDEKAKPLGKKPPMTESERNEALNRLRSPYLLEEIIADAKLTGHIGEENNFLLGYLVSISRKLKTPLGLLIIAQSSAGKSALQDKIVSFTPPEDVIRLTRLTDQSLFYQERDALKHKLLTIEEEEGARGAGYSIRHLLNGNGLINLSTARDELSGKNRSVSYEVEGPTSMMFTTTHSEINYETYNRFIIITIDESRLQTQAILLMQRKRETLEGLIDRRRNETVYKLHHNMQRLIRPLEIVNPLAENIIFTDRFLRARREQTKYLSLIKAVALLRQHQKEIKQSSDGEKAFEYIEVDSKDVEIAKRTGLNIFLESLDDATPQTKKFLGLIDGMVSGIQEKTHKDRLEIILSRRQMREGTGWSDYQVRKHIEELVNLEYLIPTQGSKGRRFCYCLAWDPECAKKRKEILESCGKSS